MAEEEEEEESEESEICCHHLHAPCGRGHIKHTMTYEVCCVPRIPAVFRHVHRHDHCCDEHDTHTETCSSITPLPSPRPIMSNFQTFSDLKMFKEIFLLFLLSHIPKKNFTKKTKITHII